MQKEILDVIERSLPAATAGAMRDFIQQAESDKEELNDAMKVIERLEKQIIMYEKKDAEYAELGNTRNELASFKQELEAKERAIAGREDRLDMALNTAKMESMRENMLNMQGLVSKVFGHPAVTVSRTTQVPVDGGTYTDAYGKEVNSGSTLQPASEVETKVESKE